MTDDFVEHELARLERVLRSAGLKMTHQRIEVFRELVTSEEHPNAEQVFGSVRRRLPTISLDTVYRTLWLLLDLGVITTTQGLRPGGARFDANADSHHHFICTRCGKMRDFYAADFDDLDVPADARHFGQVERVQVELKGVCSQCIAQDAGTKRGFNRKAKGEDDES